MSSTFRRKHEASPILSGTKAWTSGTTLVSTGIRELDSILGAGQPLGTCMYLEEDRWTSIGRTLLSYWCSEGLVQKHTLMIPVASEHSEEVEVNEDVWTATESIPLCCTRQQVAELLQGLPWSLNLEASNGPKTSSPTDAPLPQDQPLDTVVEDSTQEEEDADEGLVVAWQYRKDVQEKRLGITNSTQNKSKGTRSFCHSFDLHRRLSDQMDVNESVSLIALDINEAKSHRQQGYSLFLQLREMVKTSHANAPKRVIRLLLLHMKTAQLSVALPLLIHYIRRENLPVVICIVSCSSSSCLSRHADVVLAAEGFAGRRLYPPPAEFRHFMGLLKIRKASTCTLAGSVGHFADGTTQKRPPANVYGVKRDRRKLHLSLLHIPPEEFAAHGGSVGGGAVRSGAGRPAANKGGVSCATGIDF